MIEDVAYGVMVERLKTLSQHKALRAVVEDLAGDGWSILSPEYFQREGVDQELIDRLSNTFSSDGTPKGTIFNERGEALLRASGIYTLSFLHALGRIFGVTTSMTGRGFQARELSAGLLKVL